MPYLQPTYTVILGESKGKKDYFRAFTSTLPKPSDHKDRIAQLLPHRMKKTMRLYGVSPLLLLKKSKYRVKSAAKPKERPKAQDQKKINPKKVRVNGPEIAPNFGEDDEFEFVEADYFRPEPSLQPECKEEAAVIGVVVQELSLEARTLQENASPVDKAEI